MLENLNLFAFNKSRGCLSDWGLKWCQALSSFAPPTPAVASPDCFHPRSRFSFFALLVLVRKINNKKRFFGKNFHCPEKRFSHLASVRCRLAVSLACKLLSFMPPAVLLFNNSRKFIKCSMRLTSPSLTRGTIIKIN